MKKLILRLGLALVLVLVLGVIIVAMYLGSIIKKGVETVGPTLTKTDVKLDSASLSILSGSGSIKGFVLGNPAGYKGDFSMKVGKVDLGVQPGSVFSDKIHVTQIHVEAPEIYFDGNILSPRNSNLGKIMDNVQLPPEAANLPGRRPSRAGPRPKARAPRRSSKSMTCLSPGAGFTSPPP